MNRNVAFRHEVRFYSSDSALLESFARFIRNALKSHTAVVVLATKSHSESLVQRLSGEDFDVGWAMQRGMYISLDAVEMLSTIMVNGAPDRLRFCWSVCQPHLLTGRSRLIFQIPKKIRVGKESQLLRKAPHIR